MTSWFVLGVGWVFQFSEITFSAKITLRMLFLVTRLRIFLQKKKSRLVHVITDFNKMQWICIKIVEIHWLFFFSALWAEYVLGQNLKQENCFIKKKNYPLNMSQLLSLSCLVLTDASPKWLSPVGVSHWCIPCDLTLITVMVTCALWLVIRLISTEWSLLTIWWPFEVL